MTAFFGILHLVVALPLLVLGAWLLLEVLFARRRAEEESDGVEPGPVAVIVPAHNEEHGLPATLRNLKPQMRPQDTLLVIADNCSDATADVARAEGATVLERQSETERGKGYALQFALDHLRQDPPSSIILADADCWHSDGFVQGMARDAERLDRPIQALCLMQAPEGAGPSRKVAAFAWLFLNKVRMLGLGNLAGAARLTGAGEAFPWRIAKDLNLGSGEIVEDLALTITLAKQDIRTFHQPAHLVTSQFPTDEQAATVQRARWEHGSIRMLTGHAPDLLGHALTSGRPWKMALALDVLVPPLSLLIVIVGLVVLSGLVLGLFGAVLNAVVGLLAAACVGGALVIAWAAHGRETLPPSELGALIPFLLSKFGVYGRSARKSSAQWTRTPRDPVKGGQE